LHFLRASVSTVADVILLLTRCWPRSLSSCCLPLQQVQYSSSVDIRPEWAVKEQIPFASLAKLTCSVGEPKDMYAAGQLEYYDK
jgi:hypothetical protein